MNDKDNQFFEALISEIKKEYAGENPKFSITPNFNFLAANIQKICTDYLSLSGSGHCKEDNQMNIYAVAELLEFQQFITNALLSVKFDFYEEY